MFPTSRLLFALVAVLLAAVLFSSCPATATMETFMAEYQSILEAAGSGFSMLYSDLVALPTAYVWACANATTTAGAVAYASASYPYALTVATASLTVAPLTVSTSVTYTLYGHSCDFYGNCGTVQSGASLSFDARPNTVVMVMGQMTSGTAVNFLPLAYYPVLPMTSCSAAGSASVGAVFRTGASMPLWDSL